MMNYELRLNEAGKQEFPVRTPRSPRATGPTSEQLKEQQRVRHVRSQTSQRKDSDVVAQSIVELSVNAEEDKWREREPNLTGLTSDYDLELFRASQAEASFKYVTISH